MVVSFIKGMLVVGGVQRKKSERFTNAHQVCKLRPQEVDVLAVLLSANRDLRSAIAAVLEQEGWRADHVQPETFEPYEDQADLLIVAPSGGDEAVLSGLCRHESLVGPPLLWVGNEPPPGLGASLVRITRFEVLTKLPNMLQRAELGVALEPKPAARKPVADVVEGQVGFISPLRGPTGGQQDF